MHVDDLIRDEALERRDKLKAFYSRGGYSVRLENL